MFQITPKLFLHKGKKFAFLFSKYILRVYKTRLLYPPDSIQWIQWISLCYSAAAVCREISPLRSNKKIIIARLLKFAGLIHHHNILAANFLASFRKTRWPPWAFFMSAQTCQSADIMSSLCGMDVGVHMNNFSKTARPRDILIFFKDTLTMGDE